MRIFKVGLQTSQELSQAILNLAVKMNIPFVRVTKVNGLVRLCLDPRDLNKVVLILHFATTFCYIVLLCIDKQRVTHVYKNIILYFHSVTSTLVWSRSAIRERVHTYGGAIGSLNSSSNCSNPKF